MRVEPCKVLELELELRLRVLRLLKLSRVQGQGSRGPGIRVQNVRHLAKARQHYMVSASHVNSQQQMPIDYSKCV